LSHWRRNRAGNLGLSILGLKNGKSVKLDPGRYAFQTSASVNHRNLES
jgi:hypothetical protein